MKLPIRVDASTLPALIFGGLLLLVAIAMGAQVWRTRRSLDPALESDHGSRTHADRQFRRRMQISIMLGLTGILIPFGDQLDQLFLKQPLFFFIWVGSVLVLVVWMVLMALGDWLSTMAYTAIERSHLRHERTELEDEIRRYHASGNGPTHSDDSRDDS